MNYRFVLKMAKTVSQIFAPHGDIVWKDNWNSANKMQTIKMSQYIPEKKPPYTYFLKLLWKFIKILKFLK